MALTVQEAQALEIQFKARDAAIRSNVDRMSSLVRERIQLSKWLSQHESGHHADVPFSAAETQGKLDANEAAIRGLMDL